MRVALVHYWLVGMRGGEKVLESLCRLYPDADIFTLFYDPDRISDTIRAHRVTASFLDPLRRWHRHTLPLMPLALEQFDLRGYELVISSESGPAKGVLVGADTRHLCYCHSPMRYIWELYPAYMRNWVGGTMKKMLFAPIASYMRIWDYASAARVDRFIANSENVRRRILRAYARDAGIIHPPIAVESFYHQQAKDYFLIVSALVEYKQLDYAIRTFARNGRRLKIVGEGPQYGKLRSLAAPNIEFCGHVSEAELRRLYAGCRALLIPGEEDFGMVAVEAFASGKPVLAYARGGVLEVLTRDVKGGILYCDANESALEEALHDFERLEIDPTALREVATEFSEPVFHQKVLEAVAHLDHSRSDSSNADNTNA